MPCCVVQTGMQALTRGGTFVLVGMGTEACNCFPSMTLVAKEADVKGCFRYTNTVGTPADLKLLGRPDGILPHACAKSAWHLDLLHAGSMRP